MITKHAWTSTHTLCLSQTQIKSNKQTKCTQKMSRASFANNLQTQIVKLCQHKLYYINT